MKMKLLAGALAALSLAGPVQAAGEFSDASAVSKNLQFIAGAVEFGFDLTALQVSAIEGRLINVATFEVTSSEPRQLAIGWDVRNNPYMTLSEDSPYYVHVTPLKGGPSISQLKASFFYEETESGVAMQNITDGPLRLEATRTPVQKIAGKVVFLEWIYTGEGGSPGQPLMVDGTYRLSMVAAVYNP